MKIAVDLDGVLYRFELTMRYLLREERNVQADMHTPSRYWDDVLDRCTPADRRWLWKEGVEQFGLFRHGHVEKHAMRGIRALNRAGHKLYVVTHRPASATRDTLAWLDFHFGAEQPYPFAGAPIMLHTGEPKSQVPADLLIDDKPENIREWMTEGGSGFLFDQPWNQSATLGTRVYGWYEVLRELGVDPHYE